MTKFLNMSELCDACGELPEGLGTGLVSAAVAVAHAMGQALALHHDIEAGEAEDQGSAFGGLCVGFYPKFEGQPCPEAIDSGDESGDWEVKPC